MGASHPPAMWSSRRTPRSGLRQVSHGLQAFASPILPVPPSSTSSLASLSIMKFSTAFATLAAIVTGASAQLSILAPGGSDLWWGV